MYFNAKSERIFTTWVYGEILHLFSDSNEISPQRSSNTEIKVETIEASMIGQEEGKKITENLHWLSRCTV